jgi:tetratricopeptide (TPR) repeat protein
VVEPKPQVAKAGTPQEVVKVDKSPPAPAATNPVQVVKPNPKDAEAYVNRGVAELAKRDLDAAIADFDKAIELNPDSAEAYVNRGVAKLAKGDPDAAITDFNKALQLKPDDAIGHYFMGFCYANGQGVKKDAAKAVKMYRKAADQGLAQAQWRLGLCYYTGEGVARNAVEAYAWFSMASVTVAEAARNRDKVEKELSPQQFKAAQKRTKELQSQIEPKFKL